MGSLFRFTNLALYQHVIASDSVAIPNKQSRSVVPRIATSLIEAPRNDGIFNILILIKQELRKQFLSERQLLSDQEYNTLNQKLLLQFQQLDLSDTHYIHLFYSMKERKEPDTLLIRDWLKTQHPYIKIAFPKADFTTNTMQSFVDDHALQLAINNYGITEPVAGNKVAVDRIDMVIIPLLIFDKKGYRVGYGKGFYDRFLSHCKPRTQFIGLSFFEPVENIDDINEFDIPMHACITPTEIYRWR